ncbi:MAG: DoxX family protein [Parvibaculum sp.]
MTGTNSENQNGAAAVGLVQPVQNIVELGVSLAEKIPAFVYELAMRISIALVFWQSARTKVDGLITVKESTFFLFQYEYALPIIPFEWAAYMATYAEHVLPFFLVIGLGTRFAALGLLAMTLVIQVFVYPGAWPLHLMWAAILTYLVAKGGGALTLDRLVQQRFS